MEINGISAIITGGASGLGEATCRHLASLGAKVVVADLDRQAEKGEALAKELGGVFVPVTLKRMGFDPALAGGVILTTITDVMGFLTFLGLATLVLLR